MRKYFILLVLVLVSFVLTPALWAEEKTADVQKTTWKDIASDIVGHYPLQNNATGDKNWMFDFGLQRFMMSHTSYAIGNPDAPFQKPLSVLEFPLNTWWLNFELRRTCPRWSIGTRAGLSVARNIDGPMKDSDWENPSSTQMLTTYSESACRAEGNFKFRTDADVNISDWLRLPPGFQIRPLVAFEFQRLSLMAHDGTQWSVGNYDDEDEMDLDGQIGASALNGDSIEFRQDYYIYQIGLRGVYDGFKIGKYINIKAHGEADWGPVLGYNKDHHLLRNDLFGFIKSSGTSMYFSAGLDMVIAKTVTAGITMDYMFIRTNGVTRHSNVPQNEDSTWADGVKVWSDQTSLIAHVSYAF